MKCIYQAADQLDATMVADMLRLNGLNPQIDGESLQIAIGELPAIGTLTVNVDDSEFPEALVLVRQYQRDRSENTDGSQNSGMETGFMGFTDGLMNALRRCLSFLVQGSAPAKPRSLDASEYRADNHDP